MGIGQLTYAPDCKSVLGCTAYETAVANACHPLRTLSRVEAMVKRRNDTTSHRTAADLRKELQGLMERFPTFRVQYPSSRSRCGVVGTIPGSHGRNYVLWLSLAGYPASNPRLLVVAPQPLLAANGRPVGSCEAPCASCLPSNEDGHVELLLPWLQVPGRTATPHKFLTGAEKWVNAYERHLRSGRALDEEVALLGLCGRGWT